MEKKGGGVDCGDEETTLCVCAFVFIQFMNKRGRERLDY